MLPNHAVVGITWYEALACTRWLTERWRLEGYIGQDQKVALPSEPEWEKAARGGIDVIHADSEHAQPRPARSGLQALDLSRDQLLPNEQPERRYPWGPDPDPNRANYAATGRASARPAPSVSSPAGRAPMALRR